MELLPHLLLSMLVYLLYSSKRVNFILAYDCFNFVYRYSSGTSAWLERLNLNVGLFYHALLQ